MNREDKRGIFFGVVGVLTLIVAIIGASLAWFSINANSAEDAVTVKAASLKIVYEDGQGISVDELIPSSKEIALKAFNRYLLAETNPETTAPYEKCLDDNNNVVCAVYEFTLTNNGTNPVEVTARVVPDETPTDPTSGTKLYTEFKNLKYTLYDVTEAADVTNGKAQEDDKVDAIEVAGGGIDGDVIYTPFSILPTATEIDGNGTTKNYRLFIWLDEKGDANNDEQGAQFYGQVFIDVAGEGTGNVTGTINDKTVPEDPETQG